jgi:hypothetical protein
LQKPSKADLDDRPAHRHLAKYSAVLKAGHLKAKPNKCRTTGGGKKGNKTTFG